MNELVTPNDGYTVETCSTVDGLELIMGRKYADEWQTKEIVAHRDTSDLQATGEILREFMLCKTIAAYLNSGGTIAELQRTVDNVVPVVDSYCHIPECIFKDFGYTPQGDIALDFFNLSRQEGMRLVYGEYIDEHITYADTLNELQEENIAGADW